MSAKDIPCKHKRTNRISPAFCTKPVIFRRGWWYLAGLKKHLPDVFVCRIEELSQHLVFGRVELPHIKSLSLTREDPAEEHDLDYIDEFNLLVHQVLDAGLESGQLCR